jgi:hypothetical protein
MNANRSEGAPTPSKARNFGLRSAEGYEGKATLEFDSECHAQARGYLRSFALLCVHLC